MKPELLSIDKRLRIIERYLFFLTLLVFSYINLNNKINLLNFGYIALFVNIITFFVSFYFVAYDLVYLFNSVSKSFGYQVGNYIIRNRSWITFPLIAIIILIAILFVRFQFGIEWDKLLPPILGGLIVLLITQSPKISSWIKERLEPKN